MIAWLKGLGVMVKVGIAVAFLLAILAAWWFLSARQRAADTAVTNKAGAVIAGAGDRASGAAAEAVAAAGERQADRTEITRDNRDAILNAPGASAPVDPGAHDAGLRALCLRDSFKNSSRCAGLR